MFQKIEISCLTFAGSPEVTLNEVPPVHLNESVELKATFQDVSRCDRLSVIWVKHDQDINIPHQKYEAVIDKKGSAVLRINNLKREDVGTYTVEVHNEFGKGQSSQKLEIIRGIFNSQNRFILKDNLKITHNQCYAFTLLKQVFFFDMLQINLTC